MRAATLSVSIGCPSRNVYAFASEPGNLPGWAKEFVRSIRHTGGEWVADTARGPVKIRFIVKNDYGILDHYVTSSDGVRILVPMRVVSNGSGSEVILTLFQQPETTDADFVKDTELARRDLQNLKAAMERSCAAV